MSIEEKDMENQKKEKLSSGETKENDSCRQGA